MNPTTPTPEERAAAAEKLLVKFIEAVKSMRKMQSEHRHELGWLRRQELVEAELEVDLLLLQNWELKAPPN